MFLKRKKNRKMKAKGCAKGNQHRECNYKVELSSHIVPSYALVGSCLTNTMDYNFNYKLRSVIEQENNFIANKQTWFDTKVCTTLLWT